MKNFRTVAINKLMAEFKKQQEEKFGQESVVEEQPKNEPVKLASMARFKKAKARQVKREFFLKNSSSTFSIRSYDVAKN